MTRSTNLTAAIIAVVLTVLTFQQTVTLPTSLMPVTNVALA